MPGGYGEGYLYFEEVPASTNGVTFRYNVVNPATNAVFGDVRVPYRVD